MSDPIDGYLVAALLTDELEFLATARGAPGPRNAAIATTYRIAGRFAAHAKAHGLPEAAELERIAAEPFEAIQAARE